MGRQVNFPSLGIGMCEMAKKLWGETDHKTIELMVLVFVRKMVLKDPFRMTPIFTRNCKRGSNG